MNKIVNSYQKKYQRNFLEKKIDDLFITGRGRVINKTNIKTNQGKYPVYSSQTVNNGVLGFINTYDFEGEYLTWTTDGMNAGTVFYRKGKFNCTNVCGTLKLKKEFENQIIVKFIAYLLNTKTHKYVIKAANPKLMNKEMKKIKIPIPPLNFQKEIVKILDKFNSLIKDISIGLPAEINARKKQYKHYLEKLLFFKEKK